MSRQLLFSHPLVQGVINPTGAETRQAFCRMFVKAKILKELFTFTQNGIAVRGKYVSAMPVVLGTILNVWLQIKPRNNKLFSKSSITIAIQPQVLSVDALSRQLYILQ